MRYLFFLFFVISHLYSPAQDAGKTGKDSLIVVGKNPLQGFHHDYILFIPKGTPINKKIFLLVEPNNTGKISDSIGVHKEHAVRLASVSSVGNNVSTELNIPLLVPVFPRPASQPFMYTHALDRDAMLEKTVELRRLDLQLLRMIDDGMGVLRSMDIQVDSRIFMSGFSASGSFTNRFSLLHPGKIKALAIGGFNGELMLPLGKLNGIKLDYPLGINDFKKISGERFNLAAFRQIQQFIYMGKLDDNDAVQFDDAYSENERRIINKNIGAGVQERYLACQKIYEDHTTNATFKSYEKVGHWTTGEMNLAVIRFFLRQTREE